MTSSPRPKSAAFVFLLGAFLTGGAVGYAATRTFGPPVAPPQFTPAQMRLELKQKLHLSAEQMPLLDARYDERRTTLDSIHSIYQPALDSINALFLPTIDSVRTTNHSKVMLFLDSSQKVIYQHMIETDRARADSLKKAAGNK